MENELVLNDVERAIVSAIEDDSGVSVLALIEPVTAQKVLKAIYIKQRNENPLFAMLGESLITVAAKEMDDAQLGAILRSEVQHASSL